LHFWAVPVGEIEFTHVKDVAAGVSAHAGVLLSQVGGQLLGDGGPVSGIGLATGNQTSDVPVKSDQLLIDRLERGVLSGPDTLLHFGQQGSVIGGYQLFCFAHTPNSSKFS
jgi:hypothetical protein